jgi:rubrerythrin
MVERSDTLSVLAAALRIEEFGMEFYRRFSECVGEGKGAALLRGLSRDEGEHREFILREMRRISPGTEVGSIRPASSLMGIVPEEVFPFPADHCLTLEDEIGALEMGIQVEERSIEMYRKAALMVDDPGTKSLLERLVGMEEGHRKLLQDNMYMLRNEGSWYGYTPILEG